MGNITEYNEKLVNEIAGRSLLKENNSLCVEDLAKAVEIIRWFEQKLDELDYDDTLSTEGWRRYFGLV